MLVFVHIEKTAGTTLKFIFRNSFGQKHCDSKKNKKDIFTQADLDYAKKVFGEIKCISGHNLVEPTRHLNDIDLMFMTVLRDPVTRSASYYQDNCLRGREHIDFKEWIKDENKHNMQVKRIAGSADLDIAKKLLNESYFFVGLTERFDDSLRLLKLLCPYELKLKYNKKLVAQDNTVKDRLINTPDTLKILKDIDHLDIELYDYVKNELFPARINEYRDQLEKITLPGSYYKDHLTWNYQMSIAFNKFIYRQKLKIGV